MKLFIFSGFLGSGKTLAIISFAKYLTQCADETVGASDNPIKIAVLENEIGDVNFDDSLLKNSNLNVLNMLSGCICCTLTTDLITAMNTLQEDYAPEYIIFEPTGLAFPDRITETISEYAKNVESMQTITIVDAERFEKLYTVTPKLIEAQIKAADAVLLNKIDLAEGRLHVIKEQVQGINPGTEIYEVSALKGIDSSVWKGIVENEA